MLRLVATCTPGVEELLADELRALDIEKVEPGRGAVRFVGDWPLVWRANVWLRTANRVLVELASWRAADGDGLARGAEKIVLETRRSWNGLDSAALFAPSRTLSVRATSTRSQMKDTRWVALRLKDGIVDAQRKRFQSRSSIDRENPQTPLRVWLYDDRATLYLDTSREPLDRRGYRQVTAVAPVREQVAAACVLASGWDGVGPVVDPMCGSGTLLIEAAWISEGRAPGSLRRRWMFENLPGFDRAEFEKVAASGPARQPRPGGSEPGTVLGIDNDAHAVRASRVNLEAAGLSGRSRVVEADGFATAPPEGPGLLVVNPAWGVRMSAGGEPIADGATEEEIHERDAWRRLGDLLKKQYGGWKAVVLAGDAERGKHIGLRPARRWPVRTGPIDARMLVFDLW